LPVVVKTVPEKEAPLNILVYGAGVIGSLYAARLQEAGQNVSILARGQRLNDIREHGVVLADALTQRTTTTHLTVVEQLEPADAYDLVVVVMGKHQVAAILPQLSANHQTPNILFLHNNAAGPQALIEALGRPRVLLGFSGAGGRREDHRIDYLLIRQQPTTLGELDGSTTPRLEQIANAFKDAGFPIAISSNIDAALKTHAVFITAIESAIRMAGGSNTELAHRRDLLLLMVNAIREGFNVLSVLAVPITPFNLHLMFSWMPRWFPILYWRRALTSKLGEVSLAAHANAAPGEIKQLIDEIRTLVRATSVPTPAMDRLYGYMDSLLLDPVQNSEDYPSSAC
jgi:2-dehydropantoate 2-reductase